MPSAGDLCTTRELFAERLHIRHPRFGGCEADGNFPAIPDDTCGHMEEVEAQSLEPGCAQVWIRDNGTNSTGNIVGDGVDD
jgi:hypothetical protein